MRYTYKFISELDKMDPNDETGWIIQFSDNIKKQDLIDIGIELWDSLEVATLCVFSEKRLIAVNNSKKSDEIILEEIAKVLESEMHRLN